MIQRWTAAVRIGVSSCCVSGAAPPGPSPPAASWGNGGKVVPMNGQPPLTGLCRWARGKDVLTVEALAFPVNPMEDR